MAKCNRIKCRMPYPRYAATGARALLAITAWPMTASTFGVWTTTRSAFVHWRRRTPAADEPTGSARMRSEHPTTVSTGRGEPHGSRVTLGHRMMHATPSPPGVAERDGALPTHRGGQETKLERPPKRGQNGHTRSSERVECSHARRTPALPACPARTDGGRASPTDEASPPRGQICASYALLRNEPNPS